MSDTAKIVIHRIHHYRDTVRAYTVSIDGEKVGAVRDEKSAEFEVEPGQHTVKLRLMWISSPTYLAEVSDGGTTHLRCGPSGGLTQAWRLFFAPATTIFIEGSDDMSPPPEVDESPPVD